jgi:hypothetical protein
MFYLDKRLSVPVLSFFQEHFIKIDSTQQFVFQNSEGRAVTEYLSEGLHLIPSTDGIWLVYKGFPSQVRHLFLSHSATDILCFCHFNTGWLNSADSVAFAALGLIVSSGQIHFLKRLFFNAKFHLLFDEGITGRVSDCKVAIWLNGKDADFSANGDDLHIFYNQNKFIIPIQLFSLHRFEKMVGIRSNIRTHKPKRGFNSYYDMFVYTYP